MFSCCDTSQNDCIFLSFYYSPIDPITPYIVGDNLLNTLKCGLITIGLTLKVGLSTIDLIITVLSCAH